MFEIHDMKNFFVHAIDLDDLRTDYNFLFSAESWDQEGHVTKYLSQPVCSMYCGYDNQSLVSFYC